MSQPPPFYGGQQQGGPRPGYPIYPPQSAPGGYGGPVPPPPMHGNGPPSMGQPPAPGYPSYGGGPAPSYPGMGGQPPPPSAPVGLGGGSGGGLGGSGGMMRPPGGPAVPFYGQAPQQQQQGLAPPSPATYGGSSSGFGPPPTMPASASMIGPPPRMPGSGIGGPPPPPLSAPGIQPPSSTAGMPLPPRPGGPSVQFYSVPGIGGGGAPQGGMGMMPPPSPGLGPPPGGPPMTAPPGAGGGVNQLSQQFGQMGIRPPPIGPVGNPPPPGMMAGGVMAPTDLQSPPVYPGSYPGMRSAMTQQLESQGNLGPPRIGEANQLPSLAEVDLSVQSDPRYMRFSVSKIPNSQNNAAATKLPLGVIIQPMALDHKGEENIDIVNFGSTGIIRCKKCRTYINPFVSWLDNGRRWRCNVCGTVNDVPSSYFHHLDQNGQRRDKAERPELCNGSVEFVAPGEYMVRPPQPPVYVFVLDVSYPCIASGTFQKAVETIAKSLDELPGDPRTQFGLITFDSTVHYYNLKSTLKMPQVLVVPDISELFVPLPDDLLVNLKDSREIIDLLLESLPSMFATTRNVESCLGPALTAAYRIMATVGGKMTVFSANLPTLGDGRLKHREDPRALGTEREHQILNPEEAWYRTKAVEFSRVQISVDLFLFSANYTDVASLATLAKFTAGNLYYYPAFHPERDGTKFTTELYNLLTRPTGFEAVMRVRVTRGLKVTQFYGSYYIRGTDLLALPNCSSESVFAVELAHDEAFLTASVICVQAALLHTTSQGERRIRVHTLAAPVSAIIQEIIASVDQDALCNLIAKRTLDVALKTGLDSARMRLQQQCSDIMRSCRGFAPQAPGQPQQGFNLPPSLELLPLYTMALTKNVCFRGGNDVRPDLRCYLMHLLSVMNVETSRVFIYPRLFALHTMEPDVGRPVGDDKPPEDAPPIPTAGRNQIRLPAAVNLSADRFVSEGLYLLENGINLYLWVGSRVDPTKLSALFGVSTLEGMDALQLQQRLEDQEARGSDLSNRVNTLIAALREDRPMRHLAVTVVVEGDPTVAAFYWNLVEDRAPFPGGSHNYAEYMALMGRQSYGPGGM